MKNLPLSVPVLQRIGLRGDRQAKWEEKAMRTAAPTCICQASLRRYDSALEIVTLDRRNRARESCEKNALLLLCEQFLLSFPLSLFRLLGEKQNKPLFLTDGNNLIEDGTMLPTQQYSPYFLQRLFVIHQ